MLVTLESTLILCRAPAAHTSLGEGVFVCLGTMYSLEQEALLWWEPISPLHPLPLILPQNRELGARTAELKLLRCNYFNSARCWELVSFPHKYSRERQNSAKDGPKKGADGSREGGPCAGTA